MLRCRVTLTPPFTSWNHSSITTANYNLKSPTATAGSLGTWGAARKDPARRGISHPILRFDITHYMYISTVKIPKPFNTHNAVYPAEPSSKPLRPPFCVPSLRNRSGLCRHLGPIYGLHKESRLPLLPWRWLRRDRAGRERLQLVICAGNHVRRRDGAAIDGLHHVDGARHTVADVGLDAGDDEDDEVDDSERGHRVRI